VRRRWRRPCELLRRYSLARRAGRLESKSASRTPIISRRRPRVCGSPAAAKSSALTTEQFNPVVAKMPNDSAVQCSGTRPHRMGKAGPERTGGSSSKSTTEIDRFRQRHDPCVLPAAHSSRNCRSNRARFNPSAMRPIRSVRAKDAFLAKRMTLARRRSNVGRRPYLSKHDSRQTDRNQ
jgi:hypothetical protein